MKRFVLVCFLTAFFNLFSQNISKAVCIKWADSVKQQLTLKQKIGQLFMLDIHPETLNEKRKNEILDAINTYNLGGIILMKGNYKTAYQWTQLFQSRALVPMFIAVDGEWGLNMRISNTIKYPYQLTLGAITNDSLLFQLGKVFGEECQSIGINVNFAPCVDVNTNPNNPVINFRSFGAFKKNVTNKGRMLALGMQSKGIMTSLKHFPGHGDTDKDSHHDLPQINKSKEDLEDIELYPYQKLLKEDIWGAMVSHLNVPALDDSKTPASLSKKISTDLLRNEYGFKGLLFSDALNMKGATLAANPGELELKAYLAGNDILVFSSNIDTAISKIENYVLEDIAHLEAFEKRLDNILFYKAKVVLSKMINQLDESHFNVSKNTSKYQFCQKLYNEALTYHSISNVKYKQFLDSSKTTLIIGVGGSTNFLNSELFRFSNYKYYDLPNNTSPVDHIRILDICKSYDQIILLVRGMSQYPSKNFGITNSQKMFIEDISSLNQVLPIIMGNPYSLKFFQKYQNVVVAYEDNEFTQQSVAHFLSNRIEPKGVLPVSVGVFSSSHEKGIEVRKEEPVSSSIPYNFDILPYVDALCEQMIEKGAAPGCQVVAMHKGKLIYQKSFGRATYQLDSKGVSNSDLYDLASLTKILSTTIAAMRLKDNQMLRVYGQTKDYLNLDSTHTIGNIYISQLLTHSAGLTPFIPFYKNFNANNFFQYFSTTEQGRFNLKVAENLFIRDDYKDSMWLAMSTSKLNQIGQYKYSDLSMYILQKVIESITKTTLDTFMYESFYKPLGVRLTYNPTSNGFFRGNIMPTEYDASFRNQLIQGYVHDQGASLYGGVAGHAGLFGNAKDVAILMQMLNNFGVYNGKRYINEITVRQFTAQQNENSRRGLGFDKPDKSSNPAISPLASLNTFGHTGFTGTCAWADPDNELVFVFLSNRIHPDTNNNLINTEAYRQRLHTLFYNFIGKYNF